MIIPDNVKREFEEEIDKLNNYGKLSLTVVKRGSHRHFELDYHKTFFDDISDRKEEKPVVDREKI